MKFINLKIMKDEAEVWTEALAVTLSYLNHVSVATRLFTGGERDVPKLSANIRIVKDIITCFRSQLTDEDKNNFSDEVIDF